MKSIADIRTNIGATAQSRSASLDSTFVLFFLSVEIGRTLTSLSPELLLMGMALVGVALLPLASEAGSPSETGVWIAGRAWVAAFAVGIGVALNQTIGTVLPEEFRFAPMAMLIVAAILSCHVQFYRFLRSK